MPRVGRIPYFMKVAELTAERGTCKRGKVGCVLVNKENRIVSVGYNSSFPGTPHCDEDGCLLSQETKEEHCIRCPHAEVAAVANLQKRYSELTCFVTHQPCKDCLKLLVLVNVKKIYYKQTYHSPDRDALAELGRVEMIKLE